MTTEHERDRRRPRALYRDLFDFRVDGLRDALARSRRRLSRDDIKSTLRQVGQMEAAYDVLKKPPRAGPPPDIYGPNDWPKRNLIVRIVLSFIRFFSRSR